MSRHEIYRFRRHLLRCDYQVAFVLAIGVVGNDHNPPLGDVAHHIVNRIELKCFPRLACHGRGDNVTSRVRNEQLPGAKPGDTRSTSSGAVHLTECERVKEPARTGKAATSAQKSVSIEPNSPKTRAAKTIFHERFGLSGLALSTLCQTANRM